MTAFLILLILAVVYRVMSLDERARFKLRLANTWRDLKTAVSRIRPCEPFRSNLRERTPRVFVSPVLLLLTVALFVAADVQALGNFGPSTTNGEWWRLVTATFVHAGMVPLIVGLIGLGQPAFMLERLVGHSSLAAVYVTAGITSGVSGLFSNPVGMNVGASGAIFGIYGLLLAAMIAGAIRRSPFTIPLLAAKRLLPAAAVFLVYNAAANGFEPSEMMGFATGVGCGALLVTRLGEGKPPLRRIATAVATMMILALGPAASIGAIADVRPEIAQMLAIEQRTAAAYAGALEKFHKGKLQAEALAKLIDQSIVPELQAAEQRLTALDGVPAQQRPLVTDAEKYLRLRCQSWKLRSEGLRKTNMLQLRQAERTERESLTTLDRIRPASH